MMNIGKHIPSCADFLNGSFSSRLYQPLLQLSPQTFKTWKVRGYLKDCAMNEVKQGSSTYLHGYDLLFVSILMIRASHGFANCSLDGMHDAVMQFYGFMQDTYDALTDDVSLKDDDLKGLFLVYTDRTWVLKEQPEPTQWFVGGPSVFFMSIDVMRLCIWLADKFR